MGVGVTVAVGVGVGSGSLPPAPRLALISTITAAITATTSTQPKMNCHFAFTLALELAAVPCLALAVVEGAREDCLTLRVPQWGQRLCIAENFFPQLRQVISGIKPIVHRPFLKSWSARKAFPASVRQLYQFKVCLILQPFSNSVKCLNFKLSEKSPPKQYSFK